MRRCDWKEIFAWENNIQLEFAISCQKANKEIGQKAYNCQPKSGKTGFIGATDNKSHSIHQQTIPKNRSTLMYCIKVDNERRPRTEVYIRILPRELLEKAKLVALLNNKKHSYSDRKSTLSNLYLEDGKKGKSKRLVMKPKKICRFLLELPITPACSVHSNSNGALP